jgi:hypothetical protein
LRGEPGGEGITAVHNVAGAARDRGQVTGSLFQEDLRRVSVSVAVLLRSFNNNQNLLVAELPWIAVFNDGIASERHSMPRGMRS